MSQKNKLSFKRIRKVRRLAKKKHSSFDKIATWLPYYNKYDQLQYTVVFMPVRGI